MSLIRLPGLIDPHVHLRDPGHTYKEDWNSGTASALAGGYTCVLAMPNTSPPVTDSSSLEAILTAARGKVNCDYGVHIAGTSNNASVIPSLSKQVSGLKLYLNDTFGDLRIDGLEIINAHMSSWPNSRPLLCHAEQYMAAAVLMLAMLHRRSIHICHVSRKEEIDLIRAARERGLAVTCEVTPHHLFMTDADIDPNSKERYAVSPGLNTTSDQNALWEAIADGVVDCIATDHAPHTLQEKDSKNSPPGFPGLETGLALMLGAVREGRLSMNRLIELMHTNPARIFGLVPQPETWIEVDINERWEVNASQLYSRCCWSPFEGRQLQGRLKKVVLRNKTVYDNEEVLRHVRYGVNVNRS